MYNIFIFVPTFNCSPFFQMEMTVRLQAVSIIAQTVTLVLHVPVMLALTCQMMEKLVQVFC